jgi:hypothetical protein
VTAARAFFRLLAALALGVSAIPLVAQTYPMEGYISMVRPPNGYEVNGRWFNISPKTSFAPMGDYSTMTASQLRGALRIGLYVQVAGDEAFAMGPINATTVLVHDVWNEKIAGVGVITRVLSSGPAAVFDADGYRICIGPATKVSFNGDLNSLDEIEANTWVIFSGKRGKDGVLEAAKARFIPAKPTKFKAVKGLEVAPVKTRLAGTNGSSLTTQGTGAPDPAADGADLQADEEIKIGLGRWNTLPADQPLQQRVHRIGMALVPAYQREMADDNPSKIHFRFFAVDDDKLRGNVNLLDGVVLVSRQTVERLSSDDQLAAVLADGVAYNLQRQAAEQVKLNRFAWGVDLAAAFVPGAGTAMMLAGENAETIMQDQRLRLALALMRDAGFDPWQAPDAWRLVEAKKVPAHIAMQEYSQNSSYQIGILDLQYARK